MTTDLLTRRGGNHILNFPLVTNQDGEKPSWWDTGDGSVTLTYESDLTDAPDSLPSPGFLGGLKGVNAGLITSDAYIFQLVQLSEHELLNVGTTISAAVRVYLSGAQTVTFGLYSVSSPFTTKGTLIASESTTTTGSWVDLKIQGQEIPSTDAIRFVVESNTGSATYYVSLPVLNIGRVAMDFEPNPVIMTHRTGANLFHTTSLATNNNHRNVSCVGIVHPLSFAVRVRDIIKSNGGGSGFIYVEPSWDQDSAGGNLVEAVTNYAGHLQRGEFNVMLDDAQTFTWKPNDYLRFQQVSLRMIGEWRWMY